ncbi:MAG: GAF domain-containing protein [Acidobacteriota bacterium]
MVEGREPNEAVERHLSFLLEASREFSGSLALSDVLERVGRKLLEVVPGTRVGVVLRSRDRTRLRLVAAAAREEGSGFTERLLDGDRYPEIQQVLETRQPLQIAEVDTHSLLSPVREALAATGLRSLFVVPLVVRGHCLGALSLADAEGEELSEDSRALVLAVSNLAAVAIHNAELFGELEASAKELEKAVEVRTRRLQQSHLRLSMLNDITIALNLAHDQEGLLCAALGHLERLEGFDHVQVYLAEPEEPQVEVLGLGPGGELLRVEHELEDATDRGVLELEGVGVPLPSGPGHHLEGRGSHVLAPLVSKDGLVGAIQAFATAEEAFGSEELELLQQVAGEMSIALERARLVEAERQRTRQFRVISDIGRQLTGRVGAGHLLDTAAHLIRESLGFWMVAVLQLDESGQELRVAGSSSADDSLGDVLKEHRQRVDEGLCGQAFGEGKPVLAADVTSAPGFLATKGVPTRSELAVPIRVEGVTLGVLDLQSERLRAFREEDLVVASTLADQLGAAIKLAQLVDDLQEEREFTQRIIENMSGGLLVTDHRRLVKVINTRGAEMLRIDPEDLLERDLIEVFPSAAPLFQYAPDTVSRECEVLRADETAVPLGFSNAFFADATGRRTAIIVTFRDLSEVRELQRQVRQAERLATIGTVAAGVAHEIRNPLFGISATAQVLAGELTDGALAELCHSMLEETNRLNRLVTSLVAYGRPPSLALSPVDPVALWREVVEACRPQVDESSCEVVIEGEGEDDRTVEADHDQLKQVLLNLLLNAIDAAESRIELAVDWEAVPEKVVLSIEDDGPGLTEADLEHVFDLFYTTKGKGSGMGLAISRKIVEDHGGVLQAQARPGEGAVFEVLLPR